MTNFNLYMWNQRDLKYYSFIFTILVLVVSSIFLFLSSEKLLVMQLSPELEQKSIVVGQTLINPIKKAIVEGVNVDQLRGLEEHFSETLKDNKEIRYILLNTVDGRLVYSQGMSIEKIKFDILKHQNEVGKTSVEIDKYQNTKLPIEIEGKILGYIHLGIGLDIISSTMHDITYDALIVFFISLLVTFEILFFLLNYRINMPINWIKNALDNGKEGRFEYLHYIKSRDEIGHFADLYTRLIHNLDKIYCDVKNKFPIFEVTSDRLEDITKAKHEFENIQNELHITQKKSRKTKETYFIRTPLFLFVFAESLSISFLPIFSNILYTPIFGLPKDFVVALPIIFFMMVYTISQPFSGIWSNISSKKAIFLVGATLSTIGLFGAGFSHTILEFLSWRMLTALGYGMVLIACQAFIIDNTPVEKRTQGLAIYISGFYSASVCGSAIGAILADNVGYKSTFMISAVISILSGIFVATYIRDRELFEEQNKFFSWDSFKTIFKNKPFMSMLLCVSVPSKMMLSSVIYYITPIYLNAMGTRQSEIGRIIMIYGFIMLVLSPLIAKLADRLNKPVFFIAIGAILASSSIFPIIFIGGFWGLVFCITLLALGHSINATAQVAIVPIILRKEASVLGEAAVSSIYRFLEMQGFVFGPTITGLLIARYNYLYSLIIISSVSCVLTIFYLVGVLINKHSFNIQR